MISQKSRIVTEIPDEEILPHRDFVRYSTALHPPGAPLRSQCFRNGISRARFKAQKEEQTQVHKAKDLEGPPRQTRSKARVAHTSYPGMPFSRMAS
jgi:hypothetical protein